MAKKIIIVSSFLLNALFLLLLLFLLFLARGTSSFSFVDRGAGYLNSAFIVSAPVGGSEVGFGPVEITLRAGTAAYLQFSASFDGRLSNMAMEPLYDHGVLEVGQSGFGLVIRGISPGEAVLQLFSPSGFKDVAHVTVY
jgi:hypothetical protein